MQSVRVRLTVVGLVVTALALLPASFLFLLDRAQQDRMRLLQAQQAGESELSQAFAAFTEYASLLETASRADSATAQRTLHPAIARDRRAVLDHLARLDAPSPAVDTLRAQVQDLGDHPHDLNDVSAQFRTVLEEEASSGTSAAQRIRVEAQKASRHRVSAALGAIAVCLCLGFWALRALVRPLQALVESLHKIESGEEGHSGADLSVGVAQLHERASALTQLAFQDRLTLLPNRVRFERAAASDIHAADEAGQSVAIVFAGIDHFSTVNAAYGHRAGDEYLVSLAERLRGLETDQVHLYRYGGDVFAALVRASGDEVEARATASQAAENILNVIREPITAEQSVLRNTASVGIALFPFDAGTSEELFALADAALDSAKRSGRNSYQMAERDRPTRLRARLVASERIREAIEKRHFVPFFQPIVDLGIGQVAGVEALVRWPQPNSTLVLPGEFIELAEDTNQIRAMTIPLLAEACRTVAEWNVGAPRRLTVAFNVSPRLMSRGLVDLVETALSQTHLDPGLLELEITETALIASPKECESLLDELKHLGVTLCLDDFGTGYSSLSFLHRYAIDKIKIDRSFVARLGEGGKSDDLCDGISGLAAKLKLGMVAEGVETRAQMRRLREIGCHVQQGFLFSPAMPAAAARAWVEAAPGVIGSLLQPHRRLEAPAPVTS